MALTLVSEHDYLINFALAAFNEKYGNGIKNEDCSISSIQPSYGYELGYRIQTLRGDDYLYIHLYVNRGSFNRIDRIGLEVQQNFAVSGLGDELYAITGQIYNDEQYHFFWIQGEVIEEPLINFMSEDYIVLMDGVPLRLMES